jgi:protein TonB
MASKTDIFNGKWVDLIFAGRNQAYGAFVLRKKGD